MSSIALIKPAPVERPTFGERVTEYMPWIGFVFVAGPPVAFVAVTWLILVLGGLVWGFALLFTRLAAVIAIMAAVGFASALVASPFLLIRRVRTRRRVRVDFTNPAAHVVAVKPPRAGA